MLRRFGLAIVVLLVLSLWSGCTEQKRYRLLRVFFDGVPDPSAPRGMKSRAGGNINGQIVPDAAYVHKPYLEGKCDVCHTSGVDNIFRTTSSIGIGSDICLKCHQKVPMAYPVMHGPVAAVECLRCHTPHESNTAHLMSSSSPRVCVQCHTPELLGGNPIEHSNRKADCLTCHVAHGGPAHKLLRERPATAPSSQPAALSSAGGAR